MKPMTPGNPEEAGARPIFLPPRDAVTATQVGTLLTVARVLFSCAHPPPGLTENEDFRPGGLADGGSKLAAEQTFVKVCQRLDEIVGEEARWSMKEQATLESDMRAMFKAQTDTATVHQKAVLAMQLPQFKLRPLLVKITSETWVAYVGDLADPDDCIVALGTYPQDAMNNFDQVYLGRSPERAHQNLLDEILAKLNRTRGTIKNEIKLDSGHGLEAPNDVDPGHDAPGNREDDGEDPTGD